LGILAQLFAPFFAAANTRPNIVLTYADDQGWKDVVYQSHGECKTPVLDTMAKQGVVFTDAYANAANCQPARACLLSGNYTSRHHAFVVSLTNRDPKKNAADSGPQLGWRCRGR